MKVTTRRYIVCEGVRPLEEEFGWLTQWLREEGHVDVQRALRDISISDIPLGYHRAFSFFKSLSDPSHELMLSVVGPVDQGCSNDMTSGRVAESGYAADS